MLTLCRKPLTLNPLPFQKGERRISGKHLDAGQCDFDDCSTICTTKLFFSALAGLDLSAVVWEPAVALGEGCLTKADAPGPSRPMDAIAARNSCSRFDGTSTSRLTRSRSSRPFVAEPPTREPMLTTSFYT